MHIEQGVGAHWGTRAVSLVPAAVLCLADAG